MARTMADAIGGQGVPNPQEISTLLGTGILAAGYVDGRFAWTPAQWALFPAASRVTISAIPGSAQAPAAQVADCEAGDYDSAQAASWAQDRHDRGEWPTIYCSLDEIPAVRQATGALVLGKDYDIWAADWTGTAHQVPGCVATQWADGKMLSRPYDLSAVYRDDWPHAPGTHQPGHLYWHTLARPTTIGDLARSRGYQTALAFINHEVQLQATNAERLLAAAELQPGYQWVSVNP